MHVDSDPQPIVLKIAKFRKRIANEFQADAHHVCDPLRIRPLTPHGVGLFTCERSEPQRRNMVNKYTTVSDESELEDLILLYNLWPELSPPELVVGISVPS